MRPLTATLAASIGLAMGLFVHQSTAQPAANHASGPRYRVEADASGVWWFVGPDGKKFISVGVDNVTPAAWNPRPGTNFYDAINRQYKGDAKAWADDTRRLLLDNGFNTLGGWSGFQIPTGTEMVRTIVLYVTGHEPDRCLDALLPGFDKKVLEQTRAEMSKYAPGEQILGVFLDNEMPWWGKSGWDKIPTFTLLEKAMELPRDNPRREVALTFLKSKYQTPAALAEAYGRALESFDKLDSKWLQSVYTDRAMKDRAEFTTLAAEAFYRISTEVVRRELPGTLILGTRFSGEAPDGVVEACGRYCDVLSFNDYNGDPRANLDLYTKFWVVGKRPIMLTEFSWRGKDNQSGNPNSRGAGPVVPGQDERAANYAKFVPDALATPVLIGVHWFEFADQSPQGRFDGEDSNYGIVDIENRPYVKLLAAMKQAHATLDDVHARTTRTMPTELPKDSPYGDRTVSYAPAQHPGRPPSVELLTRSWARDPEIWGARDAKLSWEWAGQNSSTLVISYDAGREYGGGINFSGPSKLKLATGGPGSTDLDGYDRIVLDAEAPEGVELLIVVSESSSGPTWQSSFDTGSGDDGEAFITTPVRGEGKRTAHAFPIKELQLQQFHGNQKGKRRVDMQANLCVGIQVRGEPQTGKIVIHSLRLER